MQVCISKSFVEAKNYEKSYEAKQIRKWEGIVVVRLSLVDVGLIFVNGGWEHIDQSHTKEQSS
jgi:hypothetical protein